MLDRFLSALSLVSRIPVRLRYKFDLSRIDFYLPITGLCPAFLAFLVFTLLRPFNSVLLSIILTLIVQYLCFNLFHLDGLMDTADAFLGTADREKRLAILKDSRIGVYGFFAGLADLGLKAALLYTIFAGTRAVPVFVFAYPIFGRFSAALIPCMTKPAQPDGLGALIKNSKAWRCIAGVLAALLIWLAFVWALHILPDLGAQPGFAALPDLSAQPGFAAIIPALIFHGVSLLLICPLTAFFYARLYTQSLGGYTGDALGAAIETAELLCLLAAYSAISL
jgi:adenosylcobinamide-GDP ribazoletransferase